MQNRSGNRRLPGRKLWIAALLCCLATGTNLLCQEPGTISGEIHRVHGVVVNSVTNRPVARALVTTGDQRMALLTDSAGKFEFEVRTPGSSHAGLPGPGGGVTFEGPGQETSVYLMARKPGYRSMETPAILSVNGDALKVELQIRLMPEAIVTGRVVAPGAEAPTGVQVQLLQKQVQEGRGVWRPSQVAQSNLHGEYRFADLPAGDYKIRTAEWMEPGGFAPIAGRQMVGYPPLFYPRGTSLAAAALLHLASGQTMHADLDLRPKPYFPVEIPISNFVPGTGINVVVEGQEPGVTFSLGFNQRSQKIEGALPNGLFHLTITSYGAQMDMATVELAVAGKAVRAGAVSLVPCASIRVILREEYTAATDAPPGVVVIRGQGAPGDASQGGQQRSAEVYLQPENTEAGGAGLSNTRGQGAGNEGLLIENVHPGSYRVIVMPHRGYAAIVTANGLDLLHRPLVVEAGSSLPPIEVTLRDDTGTISGTVSPGPDRQGSVLHNGSIAVWCLPVGDEGSERPVVGYLDAEGKFTIPNVPPGRYVVLALPSTTQNIEYRDEAIMRRFQAQGTLVTLTSGEKTSVTAPMLTIEAN